MHPTHCSRLVLPKLQRPQPDVAHVEGEAVPADLLGVLQDGRLKGLRDELRHGALLVQDQAEPAEMKHVRCYSHVTWLCSQAEALLLAQRQTVAKMYASNALSSERGLQACAC